jgi:hypothetical protein
VLIICTEHEKTVQLLGLFTVEIIIPLGRAFSVNASLVGPLANKNKNHALINLLKNLFDEEIYYRFRDRPT